MNYKLKISKKIIFRLAIFFALMVTAIMLDVYLKKHPLKLAGIKEESNKTVNKYEAVYLFNPINTVTLKISVQKIPSQLLYGQKPNKLLQKYHQKHNFQILKTGSNKPENPVFFNLLHIIAGHYYFTFPEDDPPGA